MHDFHTHFIPTEVIIGLRTIKISQCGVDQKRENKDDFFC